MVRFCESTKLARRSNSNKFVLYLLFTVAGFCFGTDLHLEVLQLRHAVEFGIVVSRNRGEEENRSEAWQEHDADEPVRRPHDHEQRPHPAAGPRCCWPSDDNRVLTAEEVSFVGAMAVPELPSVAVLLRIQRGGVPVPGQRVARFARRGQRHQARLHHSVQYGRVWE